MCVCVCVCACVRECVCSDPGGPEDKASATRVEERHTGNLHKKKDWKECKNYREISLLNIPGKVLRLVLLEILQVVIEP